MRKSQREPSSHWSWAKNEIRVSSNVARGSLVDEAALAQAMREKSLAAAVLDVFDPEPLAPESPLWDLPGVYISAHSSVAVDRFMEDVFALVFDNLERHLAGEPLREPHCW